MRKPRTPEAELAYAKAMRDRAKARLLTGDVFPSYLRMWEREVKRLEAGLTEVSGQEEED